jgi:hypothetical protein
MSSSGSSPRSLLMSIADWKAKMISMQSIILLREALESYPKEPHFERSLKLVSDKRDLVNSIVARSRTHEERGQINEALADMEVLRTIYSQYPGLQFEVERLEKRRDQQARDAAKAGWVEQIDRQLGMGEYTRARSCKERRLN